MQTQLANETTQSQPASGSRVALTRGLFGLFLAGVGLSAVVACGDTINNNGSKCGAGTKLVGDTCVTDVTDATVADVATPSDDANTSDASNADAGDGEAEAEAPLEPDEPCPVEDADTVVFNCDPKCGALTGGTACRDASCRAVTDPPANANSDGTSCVPLAPWFSPNRRFQRWILRLPRDPWLVFGECDPNRKPYLASDELPYATDTRQPRYYIGVAVIGHPSELFSPPINVLMKMTLGVEPKSYASRLTWRFRKYKREAAYFDRLSPLPKQGVYGVADTEQLGCRTYDTSSIPTAADYVPYDPDLLGVVMASRRSHEPASNIVFYSNAMTCPVKP